jgi:hypothetical protein
LVQFVPLTLKEKKKYQVEYDKLTGCCYFCELTGPSVTECGGPHKPEVCEWSDWILVSFDNTNGKGVAGGVPLKVEAL